MRPGPYELTVRQAEVLSFIRCTVAEDGYPPTLSEISGHFGWQRTGARDHVYALLRKGCLDQERKRMSRAWKVVVPCDGPARVDLASAVVASEANGRSGVAYRVTGAEAPA